MKDLVGNRSDPLKPLIKELKEAKGRKAKFAVVVRMCELTEPEMLEGVQKRGVKIHS